MPGMSEFAMRGNTEPQFTEPIDEVSTRTVIVPDNCGALAVLESGGSFEVNMGDQVILRCGGSLQMFQ